MRIGVIGSGNVGGTLGTRWAKNGHTVVFSSRAPGSREMKQLVDTAGAMARAASVPETAATSEVVLLATPWPASRDALAAAGDLSGKILIDATNPLLPSLDGLTVGTSSSGAEQVAGWAPRARVVKAFNTVGYNVMANPRFDGRGALLFYCGDDAPAKEAVRDLAAELGFDPADAGPLVRARLLEPFALLWISLAFSPGHGRDFAFQMLKRN
ncbi:MAG TPA: NADPH-dependent F420 reductase [Bryobacteraceae bacterium]|nr:NADPH-dependent F420 reductase [Bryobacteraceae bacterium]